MTDPQLLEIMKVTAWQQCAIGRRAGLEIREALRIDDVAPPPLPADPVFGHRHESGGTALDASAQPSSRDLVTLPGLDRKVHGVWANTQLLLSAAGNVSKLLWPPSTDRWRYAEHLRRLLDVDGASPLRDRSLRNSFEHLGERILGWAGGRLGQRYVDSVIVRSHQELPDELPLRAFVEEDFSVILLGEKHQLEPVLQALDFVARRADPSSGTHL